MKLFCQPRLLEVSDAPDWTRTYGVQASRFSFPEVYLSPEVEALCQAHPDLSPFLEDCLLRFTHHDYGGISSLDQVDNFNQREMRRLTTWMGALWLSDYGEVAFQIFYNLALFYLPREDQRDLMLRQRAEEKQARP